MPQIITTGYRQLLAEANEAIETITPQEAMALLDRDDVQFVDLRDVRELEIAGRIPGAFHAPRGMLEFWIDPASEYFKPVFGQNKRFVFFCAAAWRSALAAQIARRMGLDPVCHIEGGFSAWRKAGGPVIDRGPGRKGMKLILGNRNYSSWSLRPWLALKQAGIKFDEEVVRLDFTEDNVALLDFSPSKRVPVLLHEGEQIWDSLAIMEYVHELYHRAGLWPRNPVARAHCRSISAEMHAGFTALRSECPMNMRRPHGTIPISEAAMADIHRIEQIWVDCRSRFGGDGPFLFGKRFTIADAMYAPVVSRFATYEIVVNDTAATYMNTIQSMPAYREWKAAALREDWVIPEDEV